MPFATLARRRFVDRASRNQSWDQIHRIADRNYPALRTLFTAAWTAMATTLDQDELAQELTAGNLPAILVLLEDAWARSTDATLKDPLRQLMQGIVQQSAQASQPGLAALLGPGVPASAVAFNTASPFVLDFIEHHSATLIREIGVETRQAIRSMLMANMKAGKGWRALVPQIRETIGVTRRQAEALEALRVRATAQGLKEAHVEKVVAAKTRRYKQLRARTIARHESMVAAATGAHALRVDLIQQGVMDPTKYKKYFVITPDERLCNTNVCRDTRTMNAEGVGVLEPFQTPNGPYMHPPIHILCRCVATVRSTRSL